MLKDQYHINAVIVSQNGYHYPKKQLKNPEIRGSPETFNAEKFVKDINEAHETGKGNFPSFDVIKQDPIPNQIEFDSQIHQIVLVEGLYTLLDSSPWDQLKFGQTYYLDTPE